MKNVHWILALVAATGLVACGSDEHGAPLQPQQPPQPPPSPNAVANVTIVESPLFARMGLGVSLRRTATVTNAAGETLTDRTVTWMSSAPEIVSVSETGLARALLPGSASLTATSEGKSGVTVVSVSSEGYLRIGAETYSLRPGTSVQLNARVWDISLDSKVVDVIWMSSDPTIASVSASGVLTAHSIGTTMVSAQYGQYTDSSRFGVQQPVLGKIAFHSDRLIPEGNPPEGGGLYLMNTDGSNPTLMIIDHTEMCSPDGNFGSCAKSWARPSWTRDGMRIATSSSRVYGAELSGSIVFLCTTSNTFCEPIKPFPTQYMWNGTARPFLGSNPAWSPDGRILAFSGANLWRPADNSVSSIQLSEPASIANVAWAPDGIRLAGSAHVPDAGSSGADDVWTVNVDGTAPLQLTNNTVYDGDAVWAPDGKQIAFVSERTGNREIFVMNADGTEQRNLTNDPSEDGSPTWSPDGSRIAFHSKRDGNFEIYVIDVDGSDLRNLTNHPAADRNPAWGPQ